MYKCNIHMDGYTSYVVLCYVQCALPLVQIEHVIIKHTIYSWMCQCVKPSTCNTTTVYIVNSWVKWNLLKRNCLFRNWRNVTNGMSAFVFTFSQYLKKEIVAYRNNYVENTIAFFSSFTDHCIPSVHFYKSLYAFDVTFLNVESFLSKDIFSASILRKKLF